MKLDLQVTSIPGCWILRLAPFEDARGSFVKVFHESTFCRSGLGFRWREIYISNSHQNTIRGMHFQVPPAAHRKLVACLGGEIWDVVLDLRPRSPTYHQHVAVHLSGNQPSAIHVPLGCAHGFLALSDGAQVLYLVETEYDSDLDRGVRWDSAGIRWPIAKEPILSSRDQGFPALRDLTNPFSGIEVEG